MQGVRGICSAGSASCTVQPYSAFFGRSTHAPSERMASLGSAPTVALICAAVGGTFPAGGSRAMSRYST